MSYGKLSKSNISRQGEQSIRLASASRELNDLDQVRQSDGLSKLAQSKRQSAIAKIGQQSLAGTDIDRLLCDIAQTTAETLAADYVAIHQWQNDSDQFYLRGGFGWQECMIGQAILSADADRLLSGTLLSNSPVVVDNLATDAQFAADELLESHAIVSCLGTKLEGKEQPFGVLTAYSVKPDFFTREEPRDATYAPNLRPVFVVSNRAHWMLSRPDANSAADIYAHTNFRRVAGVGSCVFDRSQRNLE